MFFVDFLCEFGEKFLKGRGRLTECFAVTSERGHVAWSELSIGRSAVFVRSDVMYL